MRQTYADLDEKLKVLGYLRLNQSDAACKAMLAALPGGHDLIVPTPKPRWRDPQTVGQVKHIRTLHRSGERKSLWTWSKRTM
jgi:hypothetical protein